MTTFDKVLLALWLAFIASFGGVIAVLLEWVGSSNITLSSWHAPALAAAVATALVLGYSAFAVTDVHAKRLATRNTARS